MAVIQSKVNTQSAAFKKNREDLLALIKQVNELENKVHLASKRENRSCLKKEGSFCLENGWIYCLIRVRVL